MEKNEPAGHSKGKYNLINRRDGASMGDAFLALSHQEEMISNSALPKHTPRHLIQSAMKAIDCDMCSNNVTLFDTLLNSQHKTTDIKGR